MQVRPPHHKHPRRDSAVIRTLHLALLSRLSLLVVGEGVPVQEEVGHSDFLCEGRGLGAVR